MLSVGMLSVIMMRVSAIMMHISLFGRYAVSQNAECRYAERHYDAYQYVVCHYAESRTVQQNE